MNDFEEFEEILTKHHASLLRFLEENEAVTRVPSNQDIDKRKKEIKETLDALVAASQKFYPSFQKALDKRTTRLEKQIEQLTKSKETLLSDNILLEYKKKDLLLLAQKLEDANEEISAKNAEMSAQQQKISEQAETLNRVHGEVLEKNQELEQQKEALLDQSDYLHEANQRITEMHEQVQQQKDEILKKNEELLQLNLEKNNLISIVAHDLKSPLNQIKGMLTIMRLSQNVNEETAQYIAMMETSTKRLTEMIAKILDVEALDARKVNVNIEAINISEMLTRLAERFDVIAKQKSIDVLCNVGSNIHALADKTYAEQIFENLISNAVKFSPSDKKIFVNLAVKGDHVIAEIKDQGPGLSDDDKKKLFGKYQKLSARPTGNETSTGLGLSIVKKFAEAIHGDIWCESEAGNGASFFVKLPVA
jgi:signal transduction histidine kinase